MPTHTHTDLVPDWLTSKAAKHMRTLLITMLTQAGVEDNTHHAFLREADVRKRKQMLPNSLVECAGRGTAPTNLVFAAAGKNARDDLAFMSIVVSKRDIERIRVLLSQQHCGVWMLNKQPDTVKDVNEITTPPDDTSVLLLLDAIQSAGGEITRKTLDTILIRDFPTNGTELVNHIAQSTNYLTLKGNTVTLTAAGVARLNPAASPPAPPEPSKFEVLRQAVLTARARVDALKSEHEESTAVRNAIGTELANAKNALKAAEKTVLELQLQLQEAKTKHTHIAKTVNELGARLDRQPNHSTAYAEACADLESATTAYQHYITL